MDYKRLFSRKQILVLGGTGSIGSVIVKELLRYNPKQVRVYSRDESKHQDLLHSLKDSSKVRSLVGDIRDYGRLNFAMDGIDIVFNAAAMKHVPLCEYNPFEAIKTNVLGTQNVLDIALKHNVEKVITISTDKAAEPNSTLGATKLLAERLTAVTHAYKGNRRTVFSAVRFGNVLGSSNSLLPTIRRQVLTGQPVTITDARMTRFIMPVESAVQLVFKAVANMKGGEIFVLKMPSVRIEDLIKEYVGLLREKNNIRRKISYTYIGKQPGEKMHEKLVSQHETEEVLEKGALFAIPGARFAKNVKAADYKGYRKPRGASGYDSSLATKLTKKEIRQMLQQSDVGI